MINLQTKLSLKNQWLKIISILKLTIFNNSLFEEFFYKNKIFVLFFNLIITLNFLIVYLTVLVLVFLISIINW